MSRTRTSERGFTLAGLIVILTIMMILVAYTVPRQWSKVLQRERDYQTVFAMKQYARAIVAFQQKNGGALPVSLDQLKEARQPRLMRGKGELIDPLTGKVDWIAVPITALQGQQIDPRTGQRIGGGGVGGVGTGTGGATGTTGSNPPPNAPGTGLSSSGNPAQQQVGPIVGVRPNKTGKSFLELNGATSYEDWLYTTQDLDQEVKSRQAALVTAK